MMMYLLSRECRCRVCLEPQFDDFVSLESLGMTIKGEANLSCSPKWSVLLVSYMSFFISLHVSFMIPSCYARVYFKLLFECSLDSKS